ncbi:V-type ATP synthase subunit F [Candidatus Nanosalina sp. VS9-1]|uniref:V-type ATP synthase subunit F n=1 Tax=Candidatus Nanosalina sp. VS9-1 TaxID=3388566 RepID=UPI0039DFF368
MVDSDDRKSIAVIGDSDFTTGFKLAGIKKTFDTENYRDTIEELIDRDDIGILVAEESDLEKLPKRARNTVESSVDPVVVALSETAESERLQEKIKKAIGADITQ